MIAIASDHGGYDLKMVIEKYLTDNGYEFQDFGCYDKSSCDYPFYAKQAAEAVSEGRYEKGILVCTTGIGVSIVANKYKGVRCALCADTVTASLTRQHNDANMLALGGGVVGPNLALGIVEAFLNTPFSCEEKHIRRVNMINELDR